MIHGHTFPIITRHSPYPRFEALWASVLDASPVFSIPDGYSTKNIFKFLTLLYNIHTENIYDLQFIVNRIGGVMVSVHASSAVDYGF